MVGPGHGAPVGEVGRGVEGGFLVIGEVGVGLAAGDDQGFEPGLGQGLGGGALPIGDVRGKKGG